MALIYQDSSIYGNDLLGKCRLQELIAAFSKPVIKTRGFRQMLLSWDKLIKNLNNVFMTR